MGEVCCWDSENPPYSYIQNLKMYTYSYIPNLKMDTYSYIVLDKRLKN